MGALSDRMKKAGWPIVRERKGGWIVYASQARGYRYDPVAGWSAPRADIEVALEKDLLEIEQGRLSAIRTLSRTTALDHTRNPSQPVVRDSSVPTFRKGYDPQDLIDEVCRILHGTAQQVCMFYSNSLVQWCPEGCCHSALNTYM